MDARLSIMRCPGTVRPVWRTYGPSSVSSVSSMWSGSNHEAGMANSPANQRIAVVMRCCQPMQAHIAPSPLSGEVPSGARQLLVVLSARITVPVGTPVSHDSTRSICWSSVQTLPRW
jgi:hypothetical protein